MASQVFSPELFNARVETQIASFFESMNRLYTQRGWPADPPQRQGLTWSNRDFTVEIVSRYRDGAYKRIRFTMRNLPGFVKPSRSIRNPDPGAIRFEHIFSFDLPREYPRNVGMIRPVAETPLFHPRLSASSGRGRACYSVRGELDRILEDLPFFVLMKPDRVEPPSQYSSDHGLNSRAMAWYERHLDEIVSFLERLWEERHHPSRTTQQVEPQGRVLMLGDRTPQAETAATGEASEGRRTPRILGSSRRRTGRVRILDEN